MPRRAATRSCSTIAPVSASSLAGDVVPQNGQTSACLAGFHTASAPHAGQANFCWASSSAMDSDDRLKGSRTGSVTVAAARPPASTNEIADHVPGSVGLALERHGLAAVGLRGEAGAEDE